VGRERTFLNEEHIWVLKIQSDTRIHRNPASSEARGFNREKLWPRCIKEKANFPSVARSVSKRTRWIRSHTWSAPSARYSGNCATWISRRTPKPAHCGSLPGSKFRPPILSNNRSVFIIGALISHLGKGDHRLWSIPHHNCITRYAIIYCNIVCRPDSGQEGFKGRH
jgi:hypothetical protein